MTVFGSDRFLKRRCIAMVNIGFVKMDSSLGLESDHTLAHTAFSILVYSITCCISLSVRCPFFSVSKMPNILV